jgi:hypothetical protein
LLSSRHPLLKTPILYTAIRLVSGVNPVIQRGYRLKKDPKQVVEAILFAFPDSGSPFDTTSSDCEEAISKLALMWYKALKK